ncbi:TetR/AcrR family transcriptional regulator [Chitinophaga nivalis]|uniref:TetR/AcrR family transcriptional regulator n=1 Tax=Chitinophaga nivalis TaxID=2991709 RepID=A0ABT3IMV8_9BACT|nr:TetR/AcrR family transcriptional regulator [Chitinophaga nivalis]MCW3465030.1 TetR/AcrR family transcriptional regulator [Chitinophaga nivalis]MCW3485278.1 TetR/AcrR family transcriptional regulator [Chitinophaga nivalis]
MMTKKEIQEQRVRGYFIAATKDLLKSEGLKSVSVRNVADKAGYSFATLYNYFKDAKDLVFLCVKDFREECREYVAERSQNVAAGNRRLKTIVLAYMEYFIQYPGIFDLFFNEKLADIDKKGDTSELVTALLEELCTADWEHLVEKGILTSREATHKKAALLFGSIGMLSLYLNRRHPASYALFTKQAANFIDQQLKP